MNWIKRNRFETIELWKETQVLQTFCSKTCRERVRSGLSRRRRRQAKSQRTKLNFPQVWFLSIFDNLGPVASFWGSTFFRSLLFFCLVTSGRCYKIYELIQINGKGGWYSTVINMLACKPSCLGFVSPRLKKFSWGKWRGGGSSITAVAFALA